MRKLSPTTVYYTHAFWLDFSFTVIFTINMIYQVEVAHLTPLQLVLVGTALEVSAFLFEIPTGVVADVYSRRLSVIIGLFITSAAFFVQAIPNFVAIALGSALWGLGFTFTSGAHQAWITDEVAATAGVENIGPVFIRAGQFGRAGGLVGIPVSVALGSLGWGLQVPIVTGAALILGLGIFLIGWMPESGFTPTPREERENWRAMRETLSEGFALVRRRPVLRDFMLIGLFVGLYSEGYDRLWTKHLLDNFTFPVLFSLTPVMWFGVIEFAMTGISIFSNEIANRRLNLKDMRQAVVVLQWLYGLMVASLIAFAWAKQFPVAVVVLLVFDICRGLTFPIQDTWTNQFVDSKVRATVLSFRSQVDALGQGGGGPVIGSVGNRFGVRAAITLAAMILFPVVPLFRDSLKRARERLEVGGEPVQVVSNQ
jgi:MFS transporter, DHA3 family, tetracycline resistance protein